MTSIDPAAARRATEAIPSIPCNVEGPVFREPWEAQAFAMAVALRERGLINWNEWAKILGDEIKRAQHENAVARDAAGEPPRQRFCADRKRRDGGNGDRRPKAHHEGRHDAGPE